MSYVHFHLKIEYFSYNELLHMRVNISIKFKRCGPREIDDSNNTLFENVEGFMMGWYTNLK